MKECARIVGMIRNSAFILIINNFINGGVTHCLLELERWNPADLTTNKRPSWDLKHPFRLIQLRNWTQTESCRQVDAGKTSIAWRY